MTGRPVLVLGLLVLLVVTGCSSAGVADDLATRLQYEGYNDVDVQLQATSDGDLVTIRSRGILTQSDEEAVDSLQTAIWNSLPRKFDTLDIRVGTVQRKASYQQLSQRFGPRDRTLDERRIATDVSAVMITLSIIAGIVVVLLALLALMLVRRRRWEERTQSERLELGNPPVTGYYPPAPPALS